ncbi:MAG: hypothetical protein LBS45_10095 [Synergistaceae bacterium]|jgi:hypothetical protein|nr:hypothetical protein [Synergistaceae bacterium]
MSRDKDHLPNNKKAAQETRLTKVVFLAPLLSVILQFLELILKLLGVIQ